MISTAKAYFYRHYIMHKKNKAEISWIFIYPLIGLFSIGILALYLQNIGASLDIVPFVIVGVVVWAFYDLCQKSIVYGTLFDIWEHCLRHTAVSPADKKEYIIGNALFGVASGALSLIMLNTISMLFFEFNFFAAHAVLVAALAIVFVFAISVGLAITSMMIGYNKEYMALMWSMPGIIMILSGVYYPVAMLPEIVRSVAYLLPTTHAIDAIRIALGLSEGVVSQTLFTGFLLSLAYFVLFYMIYTAAFKRARRVGGAILN